MTKEQEAIKAMIEELKATQAVINEVESVVMDFDGKVYNCRFEKAIKEKTSCFVILDRYYTEGITIQRINSNCSTSTGVVVHVKKSEICDNKRINAGRLIAAIDKAKQERNKKIFQLTNELTWIEGAIESINEQIRAVNRMVNSISYEAQAIYKNRFDRCSYQLR